MKKKRYIILLILVVFIVLKESAFAFNYKEIIKPNNSNKEVTDIKENTNPKPNNNNTQNTIANRFNNVINPVVEEEQTEEEVTSFNAEVLYSETATTKDDVIVTIKTDRVIKTPLGWERNDDFTFTKIITKNIEKIEVELEDYFGNKKTVEIVVNNIDKEAAIITLEYVSNEGKNPVNYVGLNHRVAIRFRTNELIDLEKSIVTIQGEKAILEKIELNNEINEYVGRIQTTKETKNGEVEFILDIVDLVGNTSEQIITKTAPKSYGAIIYIDTTTPKIDVYGERNLTLNINDFYIESNGFITDNDQTIDIKPTFIHYRDQNGKFIGKVNEVDTAVPGEYKVVYEYTDESGNVGVDVKREDHNYVIRVVTVKDNIKPVVEVLTPIENGHYQNAVTLFAKASDNYKLDKFVMNLYDANADELIKSTVIRNINESIKEHSLVLNNLASGTYYFKVNATDLEGNMSGTITRKFVIDNEKPVITVKKDLPGAEQTIGNIENAIYKLVSFKLKDNQLVDYVEINGIKKDLTNNMWSDVNGVKPGVFGAVEGKNTIVVYDKAGNNTSYEFTLDTIKPTVEIISLNNNNVNPTSFTVKANDERGIRRIDYSVYTNNNQDRVNIKGEWLENEINFEKTYDMFDLEDGEYTLRVTVADEAKNATNAISVNFVVDTTAPEFEIIPQNYYYYFDNNYPSGGYYDNKPITLIIVVNNETELEYQYGDNKEWVKENTYTRLWTAENFLVKVRDAAGNVFEKRIGLHVVKGPITATIYTDNDVEFNKKLNTNQVISVYSKLRDSAPLLEYGYLVTTDNSDVTVAMIKEQGVLKTRAKNGYLQPEKIKALINEEKPTQYVWFYALDFAGNVLLTKSEGINYDKTAPTLNIEALNYYYHHEADNNPLRVGYYDNKPITIRINATDNSNGKLMYQYGNETKWTESNTFIRTVTDETFLVKVKDEVGNISTGTIGLHIDGNPMIVNFETYNKETNQFESYNGDKTDSLKTIYAKPKKAWQLLESGYLFTNKEDGVTKEEVLTNGKTFWHNDPLENPTLNGTYYLWVYAKDFNGNENLVRSNAYIINKDNSAPSIKYLHYIDNGVKVETAWARPVSNTATNPSETVGVTFKVSDESAVKIVKYFWSTSIIDKDIKANPSNYDLKEVVADQNGNYTISSPEGLTGKYHLHIYREDEHGNYGVWPSAELFLKAKPKSDPWNPTIKVVESDIIFNHKPYHFINPTNDVTTDNGILKVELNDVTIYEGDYKLGLDHITTLDRSIENKVKYTMWVRYPNDKPFAKHQIGHRTIIVPKDETVKPQPVATDAKCFQFTNGTINGYKCGTRFVNYYGNSLITDVVVPSKIKGITVTTIGNNAFDEEQLTSIVFPETIKEIGAASFKGNKLNNLVIPKSVEIIKNAAFINAGINNLTLNEGLKTIEQSAFQTNNFTSVVLPSTVSKANWNVNRPFDTKVIFN